MINWYQLNTTGKSDSEFPCKTEKKKKEIGCNGDFEIYNLATTNWKKKKQEKK